MGTLFPRKGSNASKPVPRRWPSSYMSLLASKCQTSTCCSVCAQYVVLRWDCHTDPRLQTAGGHPVSAVLCNGRPVLRMAGPSPAKWPADFCIASAAAPPVPPQAIPPGPGAAPLPFRAWLVFPGKASSSLSKGPQPTLVVD